MKVLMLTTHLNIGGIGVYTVNLARYLKRENVDVTVASAGGELEGKLEEESIPHIKLDIRTKSEFGIKVWKALPRLNELVASGKYDMVHAQTRVTQVLACLSEKMTGVPFVSTCHGFFKNQRLGRRLFPCWGRKTIAVSDSVRKHLVEDFRLSPDRVSMVYNGINVDGYSRLDTGVRDDDLRRSIGLADEAFIVGTVGRLSPVKGHKYLIRAFEEVVSRQPEMQLLIVGDGPDKEALGEQVLKSGLSGKVFFTNGKDSKLENYFSLMDVFCLASVSEGLGLSLMEAMASGRPCVASNIGGLAELITDGENGVLVPAENYRTLSEAILRLANDSELRERLAGNAREKALSNFSMKDSVRKTMEVYGEVLNVKRKA